MLQLDVLAVERPAAPTERRFYGQLMLALNAPYRPGDRLAAVEFTALTLPRQVAPKVIVVEEVHNLLAGSAREQRASLNLLGFLFSQVPCSIVALDQMWLEPVATSRLRKIRTVSDITRLPMKTKGWSTMEWRRESALINSALWFERLIINPAENCPTRGKTEQSHLGKILRSLSQVLMAPAAAELVRHQLGRSIRDLPERRRHWVCQTFRVGDAVTGAIALSAPDHLRHRRFVFGLFGH